MNVLIIPEDFRKDQYIVAPLIRKMFAELGKANANVRVCLAPVCASQLSVEYLDNVGLAIVGDFSEIAGGEGGRNARRPTFLTHTRESAGEALDSDSPNRAHAARWHSVVVSRPSWWEPVVRHLTPSSTH